MKIQKSKLIFVFFLFFLLLQANCALALEINYPNVPGAQTPQDFMKDQSIPESQHLSLYIKYIFNLAIWLSGLIAFGVIVWGGLSYLMSAGSPQKISSAKDTIVSGFFGLLLLLSSYLILYIINPKILALQLPEPEFLSEVEFERMETDPPPSTLNQSAISTEIPWAKIIEDGIFKEGSIKNIRDNNNNISKTAESIKSNAEKLNSLTASCNCESLTSKSQDKCENQGCITTTCTCDPCQQTRSNIENTQKDNEDKIKDLTGQQKKSRDQILLLNNEINRLKKAKSFMMECQLWPLRSYGDLLNTKNFYKEINGIVWQNQYWDNVETTNDWANFYCPVSGTTWKEYKLYSTSTKQYEEYASSSLPREVTLPKNIEDAAACTTEIPVGELMDRAIRVGELISQRLNKLVDKTDELIKAVNELHQAVSQCSSQRCIIVCQRVYNVCVKGMCNGQACPFGDIALKASIVANIQEEIKKILENESDSSDDIGIINIIGKQKDADVVIYKILEDVQKQARTPMRNCIAEVDVQKPEDQPDILLQDCLSSVGAIGPKGVGIRYCCLGQEPGDQEGELSQFETCLQSCYLKLGQDD